MEVQADHEARRIMEQGEAPLQAAERALLIAAGQLAGSSVGRRKLTDGEISEAYMELEEWGRSDEARDALLELLGHVASGIMRIERATGIEIEIGGRKLPKCRAEASLHFAWVSLGKAVAAVQALD